MCKGIKRSLFNVILGGFGVTAGDAAFIMQNAGSVSGVTIPCIEIFYWKKAALKRGFAKI